jgi:lipoprotein-releasing system permease protein
MKASLRIAVRYLKPGGSYHFVQLIAWLSMSVIAVVTFSLVIGMSVFNGMEDLIRRLYKSFDPELRIVPTSGKTFLYDTVLQQKLTQIAGIAIITEVIEDDAVVIYNQDSDVVRVKGMSANFADHHRMDSFLVDGKLVLQEGDHYYAIVGRGVQYKLSIPLRNAFRPLELYYPDRNKLTRINSPDAFRKLNIMPSGIFAIEKQYDDNYIFIPLDAAKELTGYTQERTSIEFKIKEGYSVQEVQKELRKTLGEAYLVQNSDEQHASLLKALKIEKLMVNLILSFILAVSSVGIFFCLTMLTIQKKKDIAILKALGARQGQIRAIFFYAGCMIAFTGALLGLGAGILTVWLQAKYGFVQIGTTTSVVDAYPVRMMGSDLVFALVTVLLISVVASWRPAERASRQPVLESL